MVFKLKKGNEHLVRPRVTPDPEAAAALQRRMASLAYSPENGFHRDRTQDRVECQKLRRLCA